MIFVTLFGCHKLDIMLCHLFLKGLGLQPIDKPFTIDITIGLVSSKQHDLDPETNYHAALHVK